MKNVHNKFKSGLLIIACFIVTSCNYLEVVPPEQAGLQDATKTRQLALGFLYSCYGGILVEDSPISHVSALNGSTDELTLPVEWRSDAAAYWDDYAYDLISAANVDNSFWDSYYKFIGQCLLFQQQIENAPGEALLREWAPGEKEEWMAETRFLIAYYHFALLRKYGPIPITDKYISQDVSSAAYGGRYHFDYCVNWIAHQLDLAAESLPASREGTNWGRATSTMAKAVKARMLMYAASPLWNGKYPFPGWKNKIQTPGDKDFFVGEDAQYRESIGRDSYGTELISSTYNDKKWERAMKACQVALDLALGDGGCRLYGTDPADMSMYKNQSISLPYVPEMNDDGEGGEHRAFLEKVMMLRYMVASRYSDGNREMVWGMTGANINGKILARMPVHIFQTGNGNAFAGGYGTISPTLYTITHFYTENGKLPEEDPAFSLPAKWYESAYPTDPNRKDIIKLCTRREPRFYAWMAFDGGDYGSKLYTQDAGKTMLPCRVDLKTAKGNGYDISRSSRDYNVTGFLTQKYVNPKATFVYAGGASSPGNANPIPLIRVSELYLNLAECQANVGGLENIAAALVNLNAVRLRAGVPVEDTTDQQELIKVIHNERFVEFWNEGHRYFDVRRWAEGVKYFGPVRMGLNAMVKDVSFEEFNKPTAIKQSYRWSDRLYLSPVKNDEVYKNPHMVQAYGY